MGIKKLKTENDFLNLTIADMLAKFDISKTKKYTQFLANRLKDELRLHISEQKVKDGSDEDINKITVDSLLTNSPSDILTRAFITNIIFERKIQGFIDFCGLMERGLIEERDISKYDSWEMMDVQMYMALNRDKFNKAKKEILILHKDERFLIFKPLTHMASVSYGYRTKWCTAMAHEKEYFYNHSKEGVLIYVIDKQQDKKFALYRNIHEESYNDRSICSIWNETDHRIDSFQMDIPQEILKMLFNFMLCENPNSYYFNEDELHNMNMGNNKYRVLDGEIEVVAPLRVQPRLEVVRGGVDFGDTEQPINIEY